MKNKIYVVYEYIEEPDDYTEVMLKAFGDIDKAKNFVEQCEQNERSVKELVDKCDKCDVPDETCPFYVPAMFGKDECEVRIPYYSEKMYGIKELDYEE